MDLHADICYRALRARDARFDGRFFIAVSTTGIYCRPVCPARTPLRKNVTFYACAAAAEAAGYRPCRRCRPETAPGTPAWIGTSATVSRALRLIGDGNLDEAGVEALAARLGVGDRHLRRLFVEHLGASPVEVAQSRRIHAARMLLDSTTLPVTEIAFASGYNSVRRFNTAFKTAFDRSPRDVRRARRNGHAPAEANPLLEVRLSYRPPFDWAGMLRFFSQRALAGIETVSNDTYSRTIRCGDAIGVIIVSHDPARRHLLLQVPAALAAHLPEIAARVRRIFDLHADPAGVREHLWTDTRLRSLLKRRPGLRVPGAWDPFEIAVRGIVGQQVSVAAARTICGRIVARYGEPLPQNGHAALHHVFPAPERLAGARMNGLGLTTRRIATINGLARVFADGSVDLAAHSLDTVVERLTELPGVGPWTAQYIAMRALSEPDAFPTGDLGLIRAWETQTKKKVSAKELDRAAEAWRPWRAYAALHLWTSLDKGGG